LDKAETAIIGAAIETIQRIGPCNAKVKILNIEDVRVSKRNYVIERAKELLKNLNDKFMPDSTEMTEEVAQSVRMMEIIEYGTDRLPAGSSINESDDIIIVEGRADVLNLLKHGIKNAIALNGTSVPESIKDLCSKKNVTLFVDGDRGGDLIIKEVMGVAEIDFVTKAPDGKEVEEITKKEIHKALRARIAVEQVKLEEKSPEKIERKEIRSNGSSYNNKNGRPTRIIDRPVRKIEKSQDFKKMLDSLIGTRGAFILDENLNILGKVPVTELITTLNSLKTGVFAVVMDGIITRDMTSIAERINVQYLIGKESKANSARVKVVTEKQL